MTNSRTIRLALFCFIFTATVYFGIRLRNYAQDNSKLGIESTSLTTANLPLKNLNEPTIPKAVLEHLNPSPIPKTASENLNPPAIPKLVPENPTSPVIPKTVSQNPTPSLVPKPVPEIMCYPPNGIAFPRDQLPALNISIFDARSIYVNGSDAYTVLDPSSDYTNLSDFIQTSYRAIMARRLLPLTHSIGIIFSNPPFKDLVRPSCDGLWMEFGVYRGSTISGAANWKKVFCGENSQPVYGFDTFTGLPTVWRPGFGAGAFVIPNGTNVTVPSNVVLVKGLFIDTLPDQLRLIDRQHRCHTPVSYVHIDCDIYDGARDVLFLLGSRLVKGSIVVFDELFNYPGYEKHEIKALFEFLTGFNIRLKPLGASGEIYLNVTSDQGPQSFAFVVD